MISDVPGVDAGIGTPWWVAFLIAVVPLGGSYIAYRQATRAANATEAIEHQKVDAEAYATAKVFYDDMLKQRKDDMEDQQKQIYQLNRHILELQKQINDLQRQVNLQMGVEAQLRDEIRRLMNERSH